MALFLYTTGSITKYKIKSDGKSIHWRSLKKEREVNGLKYHFYFLEQHQKIDSLEFGFLKIRRFSSMAENLGM